MIYARPDQHVSLTIGENRMLAVVIACDGTACHLCENYAWMLVQHLAGKVRSGFMSAN